MKQDEQRQAAEDLYRQCRDAGVDALLDDRAERAGVKFNDADLIGIPWRITVGKRIGEGLVELVERSTRQSTDVKLEEAVRVLLERLAQPS
jgi:prolyl-tRNA synthetase